MSEYRNRFDELHQFFAGYFHQDWSRVYDWKEQQPNFTAIVLHFKVTNPQTSILKTRNQLEEFLQYNLDETELIRVLNELGSNYYATQNNQTYRSWLEEILLILNNPAEKGVVLKEIE